MRKLWLAILLIAPLGCQPAEDGSGDSNATSAAVTTPSTMETAQIDDSDTRYVIAVEGMSCPIGCPPAVKSALESVPGVTDVVVDYEAKQATVKTGGANFDQALAMKALSDAGFAGKLN